MASAVNAEALSLRRRMFRYGTKVQPSVRAIVSGVRNGAFGEKSSYGARYVVKRDATLMRHSASPSAAAIAIVITRALASEIGTGMGPTAPGRLGWAASSVYVAAAAIRLARFNIDAASASDRRYFRGDAISSSDCRVSTLIFASTIVDYRISVAWHYCFCWPFLW
jgi:hypothetical protein